MPKNTTKLWRYSKQRVRKGGKEKYYYAISIHPQYYEDFLNKDLIIISNGSSLIVTISGCKPPNDLWHTSKGEKL